MKDHIYMIFGYIILIALAVFLLHMCSNNSNSDNNDTRNNSNVTYNINHYIDTINGHIILTTVCDDYILGGSRNVSVSTLELK